MSPIRIRCTSSRFVVISSFLAFAWIAGSGCSAASGDDETTTGSGSSEITHASRTSHHPEVCNVEGKKHHLVCTGALIAKDIVLTSAHCVDSEDEWTVRCHDARDDSGVHASEGAFAPTYPNAGHPTAPTIDPTAGSNIGLIHLDDELDVHASDLAKIDLNPVSEDQQVVVYGRTKDGQVTTSVYSSRTQKISDLDDRDQIWAGFSHAVAQKGDFGGPVEDAHSHRIVGVSSAGFNQPSQCPSDGPCDYFAPLAGASDWILTTLDGWGFDTSRIPGADANAGGLIPSSSGPDASVSAPGPSSSGPDAGVSAPGPSSPTGQGLCEAKASCGVCTSTPGCGWCNNGCHAGSLSGATTVSVCGSTRWVYSALNCP